MSLAATLRSWARRLKQDAVTLWFAWRDPRTPLAVRGLCLFVVAYALSPIDLIPDFIPVLGYLDDVLLLPALIWLSLRLLPPPVIASARALAQDWMAARGRRPTSRAGAWLVVTVWLLLAALAWHAWG